MKFTANNYIQHCAILSLLILLSYSCGNLDSNESEDLSDAQIISIDNNLQKDSKLSDIVQDIYYIPLETSEESLIGNIGELKVVEDHIIVFDDIGNRVLIFDGEGNYLTKIDNQGQGPEEFGQVYNIAYSSEESLIIIAAKGKMLWYDLEGNFVREKVSILGGVSDVVHLGNSQIALYADYIQLDNKQGWNQLVIVSDQRLKIQKQMIPYNKLSRSENKTGLFNNFSTTGRNHYLTIPYRPYIWEINPDQVKPIYKIDFGDRALPEDFEDKYLTNFSITSERLRSIESEKGYARFRGGGAQLTKEVMNFSYSFLGEFHEVIFNRQTGHYIQFKVPIQNDLDGVKFVVHRTTFNEYFVSVVSTYGLKMSLDKLEKPNEKWIKTLSSISNEDNPVLRFIRYKNF